MKSMTYSTSENVSAVNTIPVKVNRSRFTLIFFKATCHANPGAERIRVGSSFQELLNISASNNVML